VAVSTWTVDRVAFGASSTRSADATIYATCVPQTLVALIVDAPPLDEHVTMPEAGPEHRLRYSRASGRLRFPIHRALTRRGSNTYVLFDSYALLGRRLPLRITNGRLVGAAE
jgi:hypothetical protein